MIFIILTRWAIIYIFECTLFHYNKTYLSASQSLIMSNSYDKDNIPDIYRDVLINENELKGRFGSDEQNVLVYGGIEPSDNMIKFLRLPSKLKTYGKFNRLNEEIRSEAEAVKARWEKREREERS